MRIITVSKSSLNDLEYIHDLMFNVQDATKPYGNQASIFWLCSVYDTEVYCISPKFPLESDIRYAMKREVYEDDFIELVIQHMKEVYE